ncbi:Transient receptor potential channel pyrexia, partial [Gryllus bimaculatus]
MRIPQVAEQLVSRGADANGETPLGKMALFYAAQLGDETFARWLLARGADPAPCTSAGGAAGLTPLHASVKDGAAGVARALLEAGAPVDAPDARGRTPLAYVAAAPKQRRGELLKILLDAGADPNTPIVREKPMTLLHSAVLVGDTEMAELLVNAGADPRFNASGDLTPMDIALDMREPRMIDLMEQCIAGKMRRAETFPAAEESNSIANPAGDDEEKMLVAGTTDKQVSEMVSCGKQNAETKKEPNHHTMAMKDECEELNKKSSANAESHQDQIAPALSRGLPTSPNEALLSAARRGDSQAIGTLLAAGGTNVNEASDAMGHTALHL